MLQTQAMIANLNIKAWTARKLDKAVTAEVDVIHHAHEAGRYSKLLVDKKALDPLSQHTNKIRDYHRTVTLPWGDNGDRLLPAKQYMDYTKAMRDFKLEAEKLTKIFIQAYPGLVNDARAHLGTMYDPKDYPSVFDIEERFAIAVEFLPVPDAKDFRVDIGKAQVAEIREQIQDAVKEKQKAAAKECWQRLDQVVVNLLSAMNKDKAIFRDSIIGNVTDLAELLPKLNIMEDKDLDDVCKDILRFFASGITPAELRKNPKAREEVKFAMAAFADRIAPHV